MYFVFISFYWVAKKVRNNPNSKASKLEARIKRKREEFLQKQKVGMSPILYGKESLGDDRDLSDDEEEDISEEPEDVIKSVQNTNKDKNKKLPSREEFFSDETEKSKEDLPQSFTQLHLSRPLLRAINEMGFTTPTPIQVFSDYSDDR